MWYGRYRFYSQHMHVLWLEDDGLQNEQPDYMGGAYKMSSNQYKKFWKENKEEILKAKNTCFKAIDLAKEYYKKHFENNKNS